jgi:CBS domain containing-hemolysin-like protein
MTALIAVVVFLVLFGSLLAMAEASLTRMNRVRAIALREEGRRNAALLERIQSNPPPFLNSVYLTVMFAQNGSAVLVAIIAERAYGELGVTLVSVGFTLLYFVLVEAMSKTYGILRSERVALFLAPMVWGLSRVFALPVRGLIGLANVLLPGRGLKEGPFVSEEDIRQMAEVGHEEGAIEEEEKELIHSIFEFGDTLVRDVMVPRPDMVVVEAHRSIRKAMDLSIRHGYSRIPVHDRDPDNIVGIVYAKDLFKALRKQNGSQETVADVMREPYFVPETGRVSDLLREMQQKRVHMAIVVDEYGDVAGLVTLEDVIEEIVGEITDEYDVEEPNVVPLSGDRYRVKAKMPIWELNEILETNLPTDEEWNTIGGLISSLLGKIPDEGEEVSYGGLLFKAEKVMRRRVGTVLIQKLEDADGQPSR